MSKTGTYKVIDGKVVKVSDATPKVASRTDGVYFRQPYYESFNSNDGCEITCKSQKKAEMARRGIEEYPFEVPSNGKRGVIYSGAGLGPRPAPEVKEKPSPQMTNLLTKKYLSK